MNSPLKSIFTAAMCLLLINGYCQEGKGGLNKNTGSESANITGPSVALGLQNLSANRVILFAGPKSELSSPKARQKVYESLSTNTLYVSVNEVVCIINEQGKSISCADIVSGIIELEINSSGTVITAR